VSKDDVLFGFRLRLFTLAEELGNVSEACRDGGRPLDLRMKKSSGALKILLGAGDPRREVQASGDLGPAAQRLPHEGRLESRPLWWPPRHLLFGRLRTRSRARPARAPFDPLSSRGHSDS
jgi:hypothetical protein